MSPSRLLLISIFLISSVCTYAKTEYSLSNESELSLIQTGGNTNVETYNGKSSTKLELKKVTIGLSGHYTVAFYETTDDDGDTIKAESARNWDVKSTYERSINKDLRGFGAIQYEGDEFSGFKQRENYDLGAKFLLIKEEKLKTSMEAGLRHTIEMNVERDSSGKDKFYQSKGRVYFEYDQILSKALSVKFWIEYIPNFTDSEDYLVNFEPSVSLLLSNIFSLKTAYKAVYDNIPNLDGNDQKDYKLTTSLLARF